MARLSKQQLKIMDVLTNGGYIWVASGCPYLATKDSAGKIKSTAINVKTFHSLGTVKAIVLDPGTGRWVATGGA